MWFSRCNVFSVRPDWRELYDHLAADPPLFQKTLGLVLRDPGSEPPRRYGWRGASRSHSPRSLSTICADPRHRS